MVSGRGCPGHRGPPTRPGRPPSPHVQPVAAVAVQHPGVGEGEPAPPGTERPVSAGRARSPRALAGTHDTPPPPWAHPALPDRGKEPGPKGRPRRRVWERGPCSEPLPGRRPPGGQSKAQPAPLSQGQVAGLTVPQWGLRLTDSRAHYETPGRRGLWDPSSAQETRGGSGAASAGARTPTSGETTTASRGGAGDARAPGTVRGRDVRAEPVLPWFCAVTPRPRVSPGPRPRAPRRGCLASAHTHIFVFSLSP